MLVCGETIKPLPPSITGIDRKKWLKLLGITFQDDFCSWDLHVDSVLSTASNRMYILRVCRFMVTPKINLVNLFDSLIMSLFYYVIEICGSAMQIKYLERIDRLFRRAHRGVATGGVGGCRTPMLSLSANGDRCRQISVRDLAERKCPIGRVMLLYFG